MLQRFLFVFLAFICFHLYLRKWFDAPVSLCGGINNETMLILPLVYFLYNFVAHDMKRLVILCRDTLLPSLPMVIAVGTIRYITRDRPVLGGRWQLSNNLEGILDGNALHWGFIFIFGVLWVYALLQYDRKPVFLKRAFLITPFFIAAHILAGIITEIRLMLPLSFIVIPMALFYIYPDVSRSLPLETRQKN